MVEVYFFLLFLFCYPRKVVPAKKHNSESCPPSHPDKPSKAKAAASGCLVQATLVGVNAGPFGLGKGLLPANVVKNDTGTKDMCIKATLAS